MNGFTNAIRIAGVGVLVAALSACATAKAPAPAAEPAPAPAPAAAAAPPPPADEYYTVVAGDHLWGISAKPQIYSDPYQWPVLFRANKDQIRDADLIHPGQELLVDRNASPELVQSAIHHARTRGAWTLGVVEPVDTAWLAANP